MHLKHKKLSFLHVLPTDCVFLRFCIFYLFNSFTKMFFFFFSKNLELQSANSTHVFLFEGFTGCSNTTSSKTLFSERSEFCLCAKMCFFVLQKLLILHGYLDLMGRNTHWKKIFFFASLRKRETLETFFF